MATKSGSFFWRGLVACACIVFLLPATVYRGVKFFVKPPERVAEIMAEISPYKRNKEEGKAVAAWQKHWGSVLLRAALVVGLLAMLAGVLTCAAPLGTSLILGGCITVLKAYVFNWDHLSDSMIFISLLIAVLILCGALWWYSRRG